MKSPEGLDVWFRGWKLRFFDVRGRAPEVVREAAPEHAARAGDEVQVSGDYLRCRGWSVHFDGEERPRVFALKPRPSKTTVWHYLRKPRSRD